MNPKPICRQCQHLRQEERHHTNPDVCGHGLSYDLVTGESLACADMRCPNEPCGPEGQLFAPKKATERCGAPPECPCHGHHTAVHDALFGIKESWTIDMAEKITLSRVINGAVVEIYRPVERGEAAVRLAAIIQGFEPPRSLTRLDRPAHRIPSVPACRHAASDASASSN